MALYGIDALQDSDTSGSCRGVGSLGGGGGVLSSSPNLPALSAPPCMDEATATVSNQRRCQPRCGPAGWHGSRMLLDS